MDLYHLMCSVHHWKKSTQELKKELEAETMEEHSLLAHQLKCSSRPLSQGMMPTKLDQALVY